MLCWSLVATCVLMTYSQILAALKPIAVKSSRHLLRRLASGRLTEDPLDQSCALRF
jgi:hypothetical protein